MSSLGLPSEVTANRVAYKHSIVLSLGPGGSSLKSRCRPGWSLLGLLNLSHASLLTPGGGWQSSVFSSLAQR